MFLISTLALFAVFTANVAIGAAGGAQFMGDVGEMLTLLAASLCFVVVTLKREAADKSKQDNS